MVGNAVLRASGDTKTPSIVMGGAGLINAILDPMLIFGFGPIPALGIQGAAIASVIAWSVAVVIILYILAIKNGLLSLHAGLQTPFSSIQKILKIGLPAAGANMLTPIAMAVITALVAKHGPEAVAAFGVGSRIESIASLVVLALSMTLPPFVSQNFGAGKVIDKASTTRLAIDSIRLPTPNAATASGPCLATNAVITAIAIGVSIFAPAAGKPILRIF
jgi:Na+-driven multidrug efflux pump